MPGYDRTGPREEGPLTGRGLGSCGKGLEWRKCHEEGIGRGSGWRHWCRINTKSITLSKEEQKKILEAELKEIDAEKKEIENKLNEMNNAKTEMLQKSAC